MLWRYKIRWKEVVRGNLTGLDWNYFLKRSKALPQAIFSPLLSPPLSSLFLGGEKRTWLRIDGVQIWQITKARIISNRFNHCILLYSCHVMAFSWFHFSYWAELYLLARSPDVFLSAIQSRATVRAASLSACALASFSLSLSALSLSLCDMQGWDWDWFDTAQFVMSPLWACIV